MLPTNCEVPFAFVTLPYGSAETRNRDAARTLLEFNLALPPSMMTTNDCAGHRGELAARSAGRFHGETARLLRSTLPPGSVAVRSKYMIASGPVGTVQPVDD